MENNKKYKLEKKEDYIQYLHQLIVASYRVLDVLEFFLSELEEIIRNHENHSKVEYYLFHDIYAKLNYNNIILYNLMGDETKTAISYRKFRKLIVKCNDLKTSLPELDEDMKYTLNSLNVLRNSNSHVPESILNALEQLNGFFGAGQLSNKIVIKEYEFFDKRYLFVLHENSKDNLEKFKKVLKRMKKDYGILTGSTTYIHKDKIELKKFEDIHISTVSHYMQTGKYRTIEEYMKCYKNGLE